MKKIYFVAIAATLLAAGCQKTEVINPVGNQPALSFSTEFGKLTKADAESPGLENLKNQNFRVWAYAAHDYDNTPIDDVTELGIYDKMEDIKVEFKNNAWDPGKQYFWPGANKSLYFFAVSDADDFLGDVGVPESETKVSPVTITMNNTKDENNLSITTPTIMQIADYVVNHEDPNDDLMVADFIKQSQEDNEKLVELNFRHTLSKVQFLFVTNPVDDISVFVQKLEVVDLLTKGDLTVTPGAFSENQDGVDVAIVSFKWDLEGDAEDETAVKQNFVDDFDTSYVGDDFPAKIEGNDPTDEDKKAMKITATGGDGSPAQQFATWLVLPQSISDKTVKITYLINERQFTNEFALDKSFAKWDVNQYVKYTINLSPNLISFDASVEEWTPTTDVPHNN